MTSGMPERTAILPPESWSPYRRPPFRSWCAPAIFPARVNLLNDVDDLSVGLTEVNDDAIHRRQDHEQIGGQQRGDERGERVVVANLISVKETASFSLMMGARRG